MLCIVVIISRWHATLTFKRLKRSPTTVLTQGSFLRKISWHDISISVLTWLQDSFPIDHVGFSQITPKNIECFHIQGCERVRKSDGYWKFDLCGQPASCETEAMGSAAGHMYVFHSSISVALCPLWYKGKAPGSRLPCLLAAILDLYQSAGMNTGVRLRAVFTHKGQQRGTLDLPRPGLQGHWVQNISLLTTRGLPSSGMTRRPTQEVKKLMKVLNSDAVPLSVQLPLRSVFGHVTQVASGGTRSEKPSHLPYPSQYSCSNPPSSSVVILSCLWGSGHKWPMYLRWGACKCWSLCPEGHGRSIVIRRRTSVTNTSQGAWPCPQTMNTPRKVW